MEKPVKIVALAGGVGGAKLAQGLAAICTPEQLSIIVNTGDDFEWMGLHVSPDVDTMLYTLAGLANPQTGWGIQEDTFNCLDALARLGGTDWFRIGDRDLATHLQRTHMLRSGETLSSATHQLARSLGIRHPILPMCDQPLQTRVTTDQGEMDFQTYFVREGWQPTLIDLRFEGAPDALLSPQVEEALESASLVVLCPSNPFLSIDPILAVPGLRTWVQNRTTVALSPIIGGKAVKGPAAKIFQEKLGDSSALAVARYYGSLLDGFILDQADAHLLPDVTALGIRAACFPTLMHDLPSRVEVARKTLEFGWQCCQGESPEI